MTDNQNLKVGSDDAIEVVAPDPVQATVTNLGPNSVYYDDSPLVSSVANDGTLTSGEELTFHASKHFISAGRSRLHVSVPDRLSWLESSVATLALNANDFGAIGDGTDRTSELADAIVAARAARRALYIPAGTYRVSSTLMGAQTTGLTVRGAGKGLTVLEYTGDAAGMFTASGSIAAATTLSAPAAIRALTLTLTSTTGLAAGDLIVVRDPTVPILGGSTKVQQAAIGQMRKIRRVDSATQVTLWAPLSWAFTSGSDVRKITPVEDISISDLSVVNPVPGTLSVLSRAAIFAHCEKVRVERVEFRDLDSAGVYLQACWDFRVSDCDFYETRDLESANAPYSVIASQGTQFGVVSGVKQHYGRHLFTTAAAANGLEIPTQDILVTNCVGTGMSQAAFDTHPGATRIHFANCQAYGSDTAGFQVRGPDCTISNPVVDGPDIGVLLVDGADRARVFGGLIANTDVGVEIQDSNDCRILGTEIDGPVTTGLKTTEDAAWVGHMTRLDVRDVTVRGNPSGAAFNFTDVWADGFELRGLRAPDATTKISGAATTPVTLGAEDADGIAGGVAPSTQNALLGSLTLTANQAQVARFVPARNMTVDELTFIVTTAAGSDDAVDVGIYSQSAGVLTRLASLGATTGVLNSTGRKSAAITATKLVAGTVYYVALSCGAVGSTAATIASAGFNNTTVNTLIATGAPNIVAGLKATSHPLPASISGPSNASQGPLMGVLE